MVEGDVLIAVNDAQYWLILHPVMGTRISSI